MPAKGEPPLSRRERQIMDVIYATGHASALDVLARLPDPPTKTAIRTLLKILEDKGHLTHRVDGQTFIYSPSRPRENAGKSALRRVLDVFFSGSLEQAVAVHLGDSATKLSPAELKRLASLIQKARKKGQ
ncbi:MAG TPA: BlaI/MecI/CopY family transcriptional regulator [Planctomycetaceae bacterium]|jgi:predicted transcriptional regulator